ncbi:hypothetical protein BGW80DRAFT_1329003 [Lactifluus volemus]|nr:hypothetical protein BGW80DRAFT_1329003 [Lactifluus volemus]
MNRPLPSPNNRSSNLPKLSKSRLPVLTQSAGAGTGVRLANPHPIPPLIDPSPRLAPSPSTPRLRKTSVARPRTISTPAKPSSLSSARAPSSERPQTKSSSKSPARFRANEPERATPSKSPAMNMKEAIALKRAEAKKAIAVQKNFATRGDSSASGGIENTSQTISETFTAEGDDLGRPSIRQTIERARSSGSLNIASRDLPCLPSALFEIHLSVTPGKLASVPDEPPLPVIPDKSSDPTTWYEQRDLTFLRARNNQIVEIQTEISLFGSLKTIDLQNNRLTSLPDSFADLTSLVNLDLSHNALTSLPPHFFSLPSLSNLDISHNSLVTLPFRMPFDPATKVPASRRQSSDFFLAPAIVRATRPLPLLASLDASHNKIVASAIHHDALPAELKTFNLAHNPLDDIAELLISLSTLSQLVELRMSNCNIYDTSFPATLFSLADAPAFPKLVVLDLGETPVTQAVISSAFSTLTQTLDFEAPIGDTRAVVTGTLAIAVGKRIVRESWEIEADRHVQRLRERRSAANLGGSPAPAQPHDPLPIAGERCDINVERGSLSEGTICIAGAKAAERADEEAGLNVLPTASHPALERYWDIHTLTLTLPPSTGRSLRRGAGGTATEDMLPRATLPLALITTQPFADTLRALDLRGRRAEPAFFLPSCSGGSFLPRLETLNLEGCSLSDAVPGAGSADGGTVYVLTQLFPSLRNLELAYNNLTGAALTREVLEQLSFMRNGARAGLRRLGLCGNKIEELNGLRELAQVVFNEEGGDSVASMRSGWTLEELDVRENSIAVLPGELGLLPLDLFLVDANLFRVPPRRVWEREGTKGLLMWLQGRLRSQ